MLSTGGRERAVQEGAVKRVKRGPIVAGMYSGLNDTKVISKNCVGEPTMGVGGKLNWTW